MHNEHNENCPYKNEEAVLYALMEVKEDTMILISAHEVSVFDDYLRSAKEGDKDITIDFDSNDNEPYQLIYGALMYHGRKKEEVIEAVMLNKEYAMITLDVPEYGKLKASAYTDIRLFEEIGNGDSIPFVALMQTDSKEDEYISTTMFPLCNRTVWENMANRTFLLACRKFVTGIGLTEENWQDYIDMDMLKQAYELAPIYTGETEE